MTNKEAAHILRMKVKSATQVLNCLKKAVSVAKLAYHHEGSGYNDYLLTPEFRAQLTQTYNEAHHQLWTYKEDLKMLKEKDPYHYG